MKTRMTKRTDFALLATALGYAGAAWRGAEKYKASCPSWCFISVLQNQHTFFPLPLLLASGYN